MVHDVSSGLLRKVKLALLSSSSYSLPTASASKLGGIRIGSGFTYDETSGILSVAPTGTSYVLPAATDATQPEPQPEVKVSESRKVDEIATLALLLSRGEPLTPELYLAAAELAAQARSLLPVPPKGAEVGDATDNPAGY